MGEIGDKKMFLDSVVAENSVMSVLVLNEEYKNTNKKLNSTLFSRGRRTESFFTEDSKLYITPKEQEMLNRGNKIRIGFNGFDSLSSRIVNNYLVFQPSGSSKLYKSLLERYAKINDSISDIPNNIARQLSLVRLWNLSVIGAIILGMVSMTFIYRYLGMGVAAEGSGNKIVANASSEKVLGENDIKVEKDNETTKYIEDIIRELESEKKEEFEKEIRKMVKGYPIEEMVPYLVEKDRTVAAFYIGIAKKESNWGKRVPVLNGEDCYNYVGYRGIREKMGTGGHTCFDSPKDAVDTVTKRIKTLVEDKKLNTPAKMVVWKCGNACSKDDQAAVRKWISDVDTYVKKLN